MRARVLLCTGLLLALGLACSGGADELPPPPPPPDGVVPPVEPVPPVEVPPVEPPPPPPAPTLPPPWGDLGFGYNGATVLLVEPASAVLVTTAVASADAEQLFTAWQASLTAAGFTPGAAVAAGDDTTQVWTRGERHVAIARGLVDTTAYVMAEDQDKLPSGAIAARTTDAAVRILLSAHAQTAPRLVGDAPGKDHPFVAPKERGTAFTPGKEGKLGGKKPGGKGKGKKSD